ncbi:MAG: helix-turn-helix domain-containing protein [Gemmatimonadetes bacterium]|nr:helix-turn-helix domain-containing protein [Gemmatimonadota bacterium]
MQATPLIHGQKGLRAQILVALKRSQPLTARDLAQLHGVSANGIRRHLKELEADQLVEYGREQRGKGAPTFSYRLSVAGEALFPKRYAEELTDVLTYLEQRGGREEVRKFFSDRFHGQARTLLARLEGSSFEERVEAVVRLLREQGFMAEWSLEGGTVKIAEHNCAVQAVAERYPEVCEAEAEFLRETLQADVRRGAYIPHGCNSCEYAVSLVTLKRSGDADPSERQA